jgi:hypothetical protein
LSFLSPLMIWGTVAAGIPIALHFFYRSRYRIVPWAAMEFLLTSIQQTSRRLKFQELLLLIVRTVLLLLLAFALMRPTWSLSGTSTRGEAVDAVLIFDTSASMGAREGKATRLELARNAALELIDGLPASSTVQIITCSDQAVLRGPRSPANLGQAREEINRLEVTDLATDFVPGAAEALQALSRGHNPNKEVYLFSDMHQLGWQQQAAVVNARFSELRQKAAIYLVRCGTQPVRNAAILDIVPQSGIPHTGERATFAVLVRNTGTVPLQNLAVTLEVDGREKDRETQTLAKLAPGQTSLALLSAELKRVGLQSVKATIKPDDLDSDNTLERIIHVRDQVRILVIDGAPNSKEPGRAGSYFLVNALQPVEEARRPLYHIQPRVIVPRQAVPSLLADKDICILVDTSLKPSLANEGGHLSPEFVDRLGGFVREGHGLMIFAGPHLEPDEYNKVLGDKLGLLPLQLGKPYEAPKDKPLHPDQASAELHSFLAKFREKNYDAIGNVEVQQTQTTRALPGKAKTEVILRWSDGQPAMAQRQVKRGQVLLFTTTADMHWSEWPLSPTYLPLIQSALGQVLQAPLAGHNRRVGEALVWNPPLYDENRVHVVSFPPRAGAPPEDRSLGLPRDENDESVVTFTDTSRAGVYQIRPVGGEPAGGARVTDLAPTAGRLVGGLFAVAPDLRETENLESLSDQQIDEQLGFQAIHWTAGQGGGALSSERFTREWTMWLLAGVLGLVLFETALAWFCGRAW